MLARLQRLSTRQFKAVIEKGATAHSPLFLLRFIAMPAGKKAGIAAAVPVKLAKKAVDRNRVRRRIYESVRPLYGSISPVQSVIFAKAPAIRADQEAIADGIRDTFVKAGLLK